MTKKTWNGSEKEPKNLKTTGPYDEEQKKFYHLVLFVTNTPAPV